MSHMKALTRCVLSSLNDKCLRIIEVFFFNQAKFHSPIYHTSLLQRDVDIVLHVDFGSRTDREKEYDADKVKFSNEYPEEAYRIRMKRKAMEEAVLEEAFHKAAGRSGRYTDSL